MIDKLKAMPQSHETFYCRINKDSTKELVHSSHTIDYKASEIVAGEIVSVIDVAPMQKLKIKHAETHK